MDDLYNTSVNTDVSLLTQAGHHWEGDIALNLDNVNDAGLIEIYETVLNRGKSFTIGSGIDLNSSNQALILAAGYLNDLYVILGNEAYADAANPTISIDDQTTVTEVNTSRFSFEGQVASLPARSMKNSPCCADAMTLACQAPDSRPPPTACSGTTHAASTAAKCSTP